MTVDLMPILAFDVILILAALDDVRRLHISNIFPIALMIAFGFQIVVEGVQPDLWQHAVSFAAVLAVGALLFAKGMIGGGDAKLLASTALWFNLSGLAVLLPAITMLGGFIAVLLVMLRWMTPARATPGANWAALKRRGPIPYAVPIGIGAITSMQIVA
jgi:prepilin peptidase CpaA